MGPVHLLRWEVPEVAQRVIDESAVPRELERLRHAFDKAVERLRILRARAERHAGPAEAAIFDVQVSIIEDAELRARVESVIRQGFGAERAFDVVMLEWREHFARSQHAMMREALYLVADGVVTPEGVDTAVRYGFGFRFLACGPMLQKEMSGWDTNYYAGSSVYPHLYSEKMPPQFLKDMVAKGHIGMKTRHGLWEWTDESVAKEKARIEKVLQAALGILKADAKQG